MHARISGALVFLLACGSDDANGSDASSDVTTETSDDVVEAAPAPSCDPGSRSGVNGNVVKTTGGENVVVRVGSSYDPTVGSPLIVVFAPCCVTGPLTETFTGLTTPSLARGYAIAYVDHITPNGPAATADAASAVGAISAKFCIDSSHVFLTGHSDGGSLTELTAIANLVAPAAIAPSASGVLASQLGSTACPKASPISVFDMHSSGDALFPIDAGFGQPMAAWWAKCDGCQEAGAPLPNGCIPYAGCNGKAQVEYCQGTAAHGVWPARNADMLDFFDQYR